MEAPKITKSCAQRSKSYRQNPENRDKIKSYEKLRQERRKLERLKAKFNKPDVLKVTIKKKSRTKDNELF